MDDCSLPKTQLSHNLSQTEPLSKKVVRGGMWVFALRIINRSLRFIRTVILARLLAPEDFGLMGIAMLSLSTLETFSQTGFQAALIQKKDNVRSFLDTAWTISVLRGVVLFLVLFLSAPSIASFFKSPEAALVIRFIAISTLLLGIRNIGIVFFKKELEFNRQFFYEFSGTVVEFCVAILLAVKLQNIWALVWGGLAASFTLFFMSYVVHPYRPQIRIDKKKFQELFGFGKWVLGSGILIFLVTQGDDIFVGKVLGVATLGLYQVAYSLSNSPATEICHVISRVTFPAYSKFQDDLPRLRTAYLRVFHLTAFLSIPFSTGIVVLAPDFTNIFLGEKWVLMIPAMQVLAIWGIIRSLGATAGPVFHSVGQPEIPTKLQFVVLILLCIFIYPLSVKWGILGTSVAVVLSTLFPNFVAVFLVIKLIKCHGMDLFKRLSWCLINAAIMLLIVLFLKMILISPLGIIEFLLIVIVGALTYFSTSYLFRDFFIPHKETLEFIAMKFKHS